MFNQEKFNKWEEETEIPEKIINMVNFICDKVGICMLEDTIVMRNRGGYPYAYGKGLTYSYCTSSYADGPDVDYSEEMRKWICGLGFKIVNSYGDNGMDSSTNWHDTYWHYDFLYEPSMVYAEEFEEYNVDDECDDEYGEYEDECYDY